MLTAQRRRNGRIVDRPSLFGHALSAALVGIFLSGPVPDAALSSICHADTGDDPCRDHAGCIDMGGKRARAGHLQRDSQFP